jgi:hypothetical protein
MIQEETPSAIWRHVPSQSNPDLISRGVEPTTLSTSTPWWKRPHRSSQKPSSWLTTEFNTPTEKLEFRHAHIALSASFRRHRTMILQVQQTHQSHCILQKNSTTADIPRPTGKQPLCPHKFLTRF